MRLRSSFTADLAQHVRLLVRHRPPEQIERLRSALALARTRLSRDPGLGQEVERRGATSFRVTSIGQGLPYLVWYSYDEVDPRSPVRLLMLRHERQERARIDDSLLE